jgi:hypothetical protein
MSPAPRTVGLYRRSLRLYPRGFREDYGPDLVRLVEDQLTDEPTWRVALRTVVDLALTLPSRHMEAHMNRTPTHLVPTLFAALAIASVVVGLVIGHPLVFLVCLAVAVVAGCLAVLAASRVRTLTESQPTSAHWWKVLAAGGGLMAALVAITTATGELPDGGWLIAMITGLTAIVLMSIGVMLGIARLATWPTRRAAV